MPSTRRAHVVDKFLHDHLEEASVAYVGSAATGAAAAGATFAGLAYAKTGSLLGAGLFGIMGAAKGLGIGALVGLGLHQLGKYHHYMWRRGKPKRGFFGNMLINGPLSLVSLPVGAIGATAKYALGRKKI